MFLIPSSLFLAKLVMISSAPAKSAGMPDSRPIHSLIIPYDLDSNLADVLPNKTSDFLNRSSEAIKAIQTDIHRNEPWGGPYSGFVCCLTG